MNERFWSLSPADRTEALEVAASRLSRPAHILEKDVWVVWLLSVLYGSEVGNHLTFKGGTSLSKAYRIIDRFSEDVDLTYDIRELIGRGDPPPESRSQADKVTREVRELLPHWLESKIAPLIADALDKENLSATVALSPDQVAIEYSQLVSSYSYVKPRVLLEFGARATGEPWERIEVRCDMATALPELEFPEATPRVLGIARTFWEKATAAHVFCKKGRGRGDGRISRHWYDLAAMARLDDFDKLAANDVALLVAQNKQAFFRENDAAGATIDYTEAVSGQLQLVPSGAALDLLAADYLEMSTNGMLPESAPDFEFLLQLCRSCEKTINQIRGFESGD